MAQTAFRLAHGEYLTLKKWLFEAALPTWNTVGRDDQNGGFYEKITKSMEHVEAPRRTRVVCRQIYSFAAGDTMGWQGGAKDAVQHGWNFMKRHCFNADHSVTMTLNLANGDCKTDFNLYDHAFALFGLCSAASVLVDERDEIEQKALHCLDAMLKTWKHPVAGFEEAIPSIVPLCSNPHMHLMEAFLAWAERASHEHRQAWLSLANEIGELCLSKFISPETGAIREYYQHDWSVKFDEQASPVEPGHQFEWAWLLGRWGRLTLRKDALVAARRLVEIGETCGVNANRLVINGLDHDLKPCDVAFRLWPQTERIKAWVMMAELAVGKDDRNHALQKIAEATEGLSAFLSEVPAGLWCDRLSADGTPIDEPAPASSLYHITCAIAEMHRCLDRADECRPALFLDRDGVIVEDSGYVGDFKTIRLLDGVAEAIRFFRDNGYYVFVVTNQSGIGRNYYDEDDYNLVRAEIARSLALQNSFVDDERACPYYELSKNPRYLRGKDWRKPHSGMIVDLVTEWNVDVQKSCLIGDKESDIEAARAAKVQGYLFEGGSLHEFVKKIRNL